MVDNLFRSAVFNHQLEMRLPPLAGGMQNAAIWDGIETNRTTTGAVAADVIDAIESSTEFALGAMGDFSRMTRRERSVIKRAIPFYPWLRHQTRISLRLPFNNPMRGAFLNMMYTIFSEDDGEKWEQEFGASVETPLGRVDLRSMMPFSRSLGDIPLSPFSDNPARSLNPIPSSLSSSSLSPATPSSATCSSPL